MGNIELSVIHVRIFESVVKAIAITAIAAMEYQLIKTGQDGELLLPISFIIGVISGVKAGDITSYISKK